MLWGNRSKTNWNQTLNPTELGGNCFASCFANPGLIASPTRWSASLPYCWMPIIYMYCMYHMYQIRTSFEQFCFNDLLSSRAEKPRFIEQLHIDNLHCYYFLSVMTRVRGWLFPVCAYLEIMDWWLNQHEVTQKRVSDVQWKPLILHTYGRKVCVK